MSVGNRLTGMLSEWSEGSDATATVIIMFTVLIGLLIPFLLLQPPVPFDYPSLEDVIVVCAMAPFAEEVLFRAGLQPFLHRVLSKALSPEQASLHVAALIPNTLTSMIFVACHEIGSNPHFFETCGIFAASFALGAMADRGLRLTLLVVVHGSWNLSFLIAATSRLTS